MSDGSQIRSTARPTSCTGSRRSACRSLVVDGEPVLGVVHAPMLGNLYSARRGGGAFRDGERISVSQRPVSSAISATGLPVPREARAPRRVPSRLRARAPGVRRPSTRRRREPRPRVDRRRRVRRLLRAEPRHVGCRRGGLIVREAGGVVTDWQGDERKWIQSGDIVAGPPAVHARILEIIAAAAAAT